MGRILTDREEMERYSRGREQSEQRYGKHEAMYTYTEVAGTFRHGREWQERRLEEGDQAKFGEI